MRNADKRLVRAEGLEPPQLSSLEPKSSASTSSATPADSIMSGRDAAGGGLITWAHRFAAKKWPFRNLPGRKPRQLDISSGKWSASGDGEIALFQPLDRRDAAWPDWALRCSDPALASAEWPPRGGRPLTLQAKADALALRPRPAGHPDLVASAGWPSRTPASSAATRSRSRSATTLPAPIALNWHGHRRRSGGEPLLAQAAAGARRTGHVSRLPLRHAGTFMCDAGLLGRRRRRGHPGARR